MAIANVILVYLMLISKFTPCTVRAMTAPQPISV